jgi:hypothetical protein
MSTQTNARIRRNLERFAVKAPEQSDEIPELPEDVTLLDDSGLMVLYRRLVAWCEYADQIKADASAMEERAKTEVRYAEAAHTALSGAKTVAAKKAEAALDSRVQDTQYDQLSAHHNDKRAEAAVKLVERRLSLVSREITRRSNAVRGRER